VVIRGGRVISSRLESADRRLYLDLNHDPARGVVVMGSGRSGTTWLAELLAQGLRARLVYEPFHPWQTAARGEPAPLFPWPDAHEHGFRAYVDALLAGRVRARRLERPRPVRLPRSRVLKDVHAMNVLPWMRTHFPALPLVLLLRHPFAVSASRLRAGERFRGRPFYGLGGYPASDTGRAEAEAGPAAQWLPIWDRFKHDPDPLVRYAAEWCIENIYPVGVATDYGITTLNYEDLVLDARGTLSLLASECRFTSFNEVKDVARASSTDWLGRVATAQQLADREWLIGDWRQDVTGRALRRCTQVLEAFGLTHLYDADRLLPVGSRT